MIHESMRLKYEPASETLHIYVVVVFTSLAAPWLQGNSSGHLAVVDLLMDAGVSVDEVLYERGPLLGS